jgi:hypothetical protein
VSLHRAGGPAKILKEQPLLALLETLKEQQQQLSEQQQQLSEQQQQLSEQQQQNYQGLVLDLFHPTSSVASSKELKRYRNAALEFYYGSSAYAEYTCMVTGMECSAGELVAGHIYRQQWPKSLLVSKLPATGHGLMQLCSQTAQTLFDGALAFWHCPQHWSQPWGYHAVHAGGFVFGTETV